MRLFAARNADYRHVTQAADSLRRAVNGDVVRCVVNRNQLPKHLPFPVQVLRLLERPHA